MIAARRNLVERSAVPGILVAIALDAGETVGRVGAHLGTSMARVRRASSRRRRTALSGGGAVRVIANVSSVAWPTSASVRGSCRYGAALAQGISVRTLP
jgi:hypothetical protein